MKQVFTLSKSNKSYFGVVAVLLFVIFIAFSDKTTYQIGEFTGKLISSIVFPSIFAWIVWRLSGRSEKSGSLTFNIVLTLILLSQIGQLSNKLQKSQKLRELLVQKSEFKKKFSSTDDQAEIDIAYNEYKDSIIDGLDNLSEVSSGQEKQIYRILSDFTTESQITIQNWRESYAAILSPRILDYSLLISDEEFDYQKNIFRTYIKKTQIYAEFLVNMVPNIKKRLSVLGEGSTHAKDAIKGVTKQYLSQQPILEPLIQEHIEYGKKMIQLIELLQKNKDQWIYENDELFIHSDNVLNKFNELIDELSKNEATINTLSQNLVEKM